MIEILAEAEYRCACTCCGEIAMNYALREWGYGGLDGRAPGELRVVLKLLFDLYIEKLEGGA